MRHTRSVVNKNLPKFYIGLHNVTKNNSALKKERQ